MTTSLAALATAGSAADADESAVAVMLSWPGRRGDSALPGGTPYGGSHVVELIGEVDCLLTSRVRSTLVTLAAQSAELAVDVSGVRFIDASGLGLLAVMHRQVTEAGGRMSLIGVTPRLRRLLRIARLEHLLPGEP